MIKLMNALHKQEKGFTLVELMIVVVIIGILVAIAVPIFNNVQTGAAQRAHDANLRTIDGAIMMYYAENGDYPGTIEDLEGEYIEAGLTIPERVQSAVGDETEYGFNTSGDVTKAAPGGNWEGAYNAGLEIDE